mmetsp:Transcript_13472/g.37243  ORF Transcript_13472/g.37243 Transcript_13472/m.37243 type:complete len:92 (-) Transcript_13472:30-305(-)
MEETEAHPAPTEPLITTLADSENSFSTDATITDIIIPKKGAKKKKAPPKKAAPLQKKSAAPTKKRKENTKHRRRKQLKQKRLASCLHSWIV